jgi:hypothetical protein
LLVRDARFPETIAEGSPAELVAPFLLNAGVWTTWSEAGSEILGPGQHTLMRRVVDQLKERAIVTGLELLDRALRTELSIDSVKAIPHLRRIAEKEDFPERAAIMEATKRISRFVSDIRAVSDSDADVATTLATMNAETLSGDLLIPKPLIEAALRIIRYRYAEKEKELSEESEQNS